MMYAYNELYVEKAMTAMGTMLNFAVNDAGYNIDFFFGMFINSGIADAFSRGEPKYVAGMSGIELAYEVIYKIKNEMCKARISQTNGRSPEYWAGWIYAYYQWQSGQSIRSIDEYIKPSEIVGLYNPYHEMDRLQFVDAVDKKIEESKMTTRLKLYRDRLGYSQSTLADKANVSVRMIQNYEQRRKDINKAQSDTLFMLASAMHCNMEDLLEKDKLSDNYRHKAQKDN